MTRNDSFRRKIIYICLIPVLLIPLAFVSQPATVSKGSGETSSSGILSKIRKDHRLSQAEISEVDPASESMKLCYFGLASGCCDNALASDPGIEEEATVGPDADFNPNIDRAPTELYQSLGVSGP